jgi:hypothetical protein
LVRGTRGYAACLGDAVKLQLQQQPISEFNESRTNCGQFVQRDCRTATATDQIAANLQRSIGWNWRINRVAFNTSGYGLRHAHVTERLLGDRIEEQTRIELCGSILVAN